MEMVIAVVRRGGKSLGIIVVVKERPRIGDKTVAAIFVIRDGKDVALIAGGRWSVTAYADENENETGNVDGLNSFLDVAYGNSLTPLVQAGNEHGNPYSDHLSAHNLAFHFVVR